MTTQTLAKETTTITATSTPNFYDVTSSNGWDHYALVVEENGTVICACKGFFYKGHCYHADQAIEELTFIAPAVEVEVIEAEEELVRPVVIPGTDGKEVICSNCGAWVMSRVFDRHKSGRFCEVYGGVLPAAAPVLVAAAAPVTTPDEDPTRCGCGKAGFSMVGGQWYCGPCIQEMAAAVAEAEKIVAPAMYEFRNPGDNLPGGEYELPSTGGNRCQNCKRPFMSDEWDCYYTDCPGKALIQSTEPTAAPTGAICVECGLYPPLPNSEICINCNEYLYDEYVATMQPTQEQVVREAAYWHSLGLEGQFAAHQEKELEDHLLAEYDALPQEEKDRMEEEEGRGADWQAERAAYAKDNHDIFGIF